MPNLSDVVKTKLQIIFSHFLSIGGEVKPTKEGKSGFMIWNHFDIVSQLDGQHVELSSGKTSVDGWRYIVKPPTFNPNTGEKMNGYAGFGPAEENKQLTADELIDKV